MCISCKMQSIFEGVQYLSEEAHDRLYKQPADGGVCIESAFSRNEVRVTHVLKFATEAKDV